MLKLKVHEIEDAERLDLTSQIAPDQIDLDVPEHPRLIEPAAIKIHAEALEGEVVVLGQVTARVSLSCSRCLESAEAALSASFEVHAPLTQPDVDLTDEVRQGLLLALPPKPLCRENCKGLCARCGKNLNMGPCGCAAGKGKETSFSKLSEFKIKPGV